MFSISTLAHSEYDVRAQWLAYLRWCRRSQSMSDYLIVPVELISALCVLAQSHTTTLTWKSSTLTLLSTKQVSRKISSNSCVYVIFRSSMLYCTRRFFVLTFVDEFVIVPFHIHWTFMTWKLAMPIKFTREQMSQLSFQAFTRSETRNRRNRRQSLLTNKYILVYRYRDSMFFFPLWEMEAKRRINTFSEA